MDIRRQATVYDRQVEEAAERPTAPDSSSTKHLRYPENIHYHLHTTEGTHTLRFHLNHRLIRPIFTTEELL